MHNIKSILIGLLLAAVILISIAASVAYFYEDKVSQYLIAELNEYLLAEVEVEEVNFSLIKKFPQASLELKNVLAHSKESYYPKIKEHNTDTLFFAQSLYIQFNLLDLISKNYTINSIHFDKGNINLFVDHLGDPNYIFWDTSESTEKGEFSFALKEVKITQAEILYCNDANNLMQRSYVNKLDFEGNFSNQNYLMKIKLDQFTENLSVSEVDYIFKKKNEIKSGFRYYQQ